MSDVIVPYSDLFSLSIELAKSNLLPGLFFNKPANVLAQILTGREFGLGPMQSMRGFDIIGGKVSMTSGMIGALVLSSPVCVYLTPVKATDKIATFRTQRRGSPEPVEMSYTIEDAKLAGLVSKDNWRKNPIAMLLARAQARIGRAVYPDLVHGVYDRESDELDVGPPVSESIPVSDLKAKFKAEIVDAELVSVEPEPVLSLSEQISTAQTTDDLRTLLDAIKASDDIEILKPMYFARLGVLKESA